MLLNKFNRPLRLRRKPSTLLAIYLLLIHLFSLLAVFVTDFNSITKLSWTVVIVLAGLHYLRWYRVRSFDNTGGWVWQKDDVWLEHENGDIKFWLLQEDYVITPLFIVIRLTNKSGKKKSVLWFKDQIASDDFRRLGVKLKYYQGVAMRIEDTAV